MPQHPIPAGETTQPADHQPAAPGAAFQDSPVPMFLIGSDGIVRRANRRAGALLGLPVLYAKGKLFAAFVEHQTRAAVQAQLAAAQQTGEERRVHCGILGSAGPVDNVLDISPAETPGQLVVAAACGGPEPGHRPPPDLAAMIAVREATARGDVLSAAARLVLRSATSSEAVLARRSAKLLASELTAWVLIDLEREFRLRRQYVAAPRSGRSGLANSLAGLDPAPGSVPCHVHQSGGSYLVAHAEDTGLLGADGYGRPILSRLGAMSVLTVPLSCDDCCYGTLTLVREDADGYFGLADVGLAEQIGECIALGIRAQRASGQPRGGTRCRASRLAAARRGVRRWGRRQRPTGHPLEPGRW
jgi:GAF domain-containing protein